MGDIYQYEGIRVGSGQAYQLETKVVGLLEFSDRRGEPISGIHVQHTISSKNGAAIYDSFYDSRDLSLAQVVMCRSAQDPYLDNRCENNLNEIVFGNGPGEFLFGASYFWQFELESDEESVYQDTTSGSAEWFVEQNQSSLAVSGGQTWDNRRELSIGPLFCNSYYDLVEIRASDGIPTRCESKIETWELISFSLGQGENIEFQNRRVFEVMETTLGPIPTESNSGYISFGLNEAMAVAISNDNFVSDFVEQEFWIHEAYHEVNNAANLCSSTPAEGCVDESSWEIALQHRNGDLLEFDVYKQTFANSPSTYRVDGHDAYSVDAIPKMKGGPTSTDLSVDFLNVEAQLMAHGQSIDSLRILLDYNREINDLNILDTGVGYIVSYNIAAPNCVGICPILFSELSRGETSWIHHKGHFSNPW